MLPSLAAPRDLRAGHRGRAPIRLCNRRPTMAPVAPSPSVA